MLPALNLSQHWRSKHAPVCKAARDTWPPPLPGSQQCSLAADSCVQRHKVLKNQQGRCYDRSKQNVFSERTVRCSGEDPRTPLIAPPLDHGKRTHKAMPTQDSPPPGHGKGAAENSVQRARFTDSWCTSCGRREDGMWVGRTKLGRRLLLPCGRIRRVPSLFTPAFSGAQPPGARA